MTTTSSTYFTIAHQIRRRIRVIIPGLRKDAERMYILSILLHKHSGVEAVKPVAAIASLTVHFDPQRIPVAQLLARMDSMIETISHKARTSFVEERTSPPADDQPLQTLTFGVDGMSCTACALFLELLLRRHPYVQQADVDYVSGSGCMTGYLSSSALVELIEAHGYQAFVIESPSQHKLLLDLERQQLHTHKRLLQRAALLSLPVAGLSLFTKPSWLGLLIQALLTTAVIAKSGQPMFKQAWTRARQGHASMDSLVALGVGAAYVYSLPALLRPERHAYFDAATAIIDFVLVGRYLEALAKNRMVNDIRRLVDLHPQQALLLRDQQAIATAVSDIRKQDLLQVRPGSRIPVDGVVVDGLSNVDESGIGVRGYQIKESGHAVLAGSLNGSGVLTIRAKAVGSDTVYAQVLHMMSQTQKTHLSMQKSVDQWASRFVPMMLLLSSATFAGWLARGVGWAHALANALSVLLISCPCALGLATSAATTVSLSQAARRGLYLRHGSALDTVCSVNTVIFDKTGTLTEGQATISNLLNISTFDDQQLVQWAASVVSRSEHIATQALLQAAQKQKLPLLDVSRFHSTPGQGVRAMIKDDEVLLGTYQWLQTHGIVTQALQHAAHALHAQAETLVYMAVDKQAVAVFVLHDQTKTDARSVMQQLQAWNIDTLLLTGDGEAVARCVAAEVGIEHIIADADPAKKLAVVKRLQQRGYRVAMVGDGVNDAPALLAAELGVAMGSGSDLAIESADLVLAQNDLTAMIAMMQLGDETRRHIRQNLYWAFIYNGLAIPIAVAGRLTPTVASLSMAFSSISVVANSLRRFS